MTGLRERGKSRRRSEIVAAAAALWRKHGVDNVSLARVAEVAEVAPQTIHNLIGAHDALVFAVIDELLDRLDAARAALPPMRGVDQAVALARISADMFIAEAPLYRQLVVGIPKAMFGGARFAHDSAQLQVAAFRAAQAEGDVRPDISADVAGHAVFNAYLGALYVWAVRQIDDAGFVAAAELAALMPLCACATDAALPDLQLLLHDALATAASRPALMSFA